MDEGEGEGMRKEGRLERWWAILIAAAGLLPAQAGAVDCDTIIPPPFTLNLVTSIKLSPFNSGGTDVWGWTAPDGTEYAIMGTYYGVAIVNAKTLEVADTLIGPGPCGSTWRDIKTYQNYAYVVSECTGTNQGMMIIDLQYLPDSVRLVGVYSQPGDVTSHNLTIDTARGYAYLVKQSADGFRIVSLANPKVPVDFPYVSTGNLHDVFARNDTVWAAEGWLSSYSMWNMADKMNPQFIARWSTPSGGYAHNIWPSDDGDIAVTTEETGGVMMKAWDISDPQNVQLKSQFIAPSNLAHNVHMRGRLAVTSHYQSGLHVADLNVPECPKQVALYDTWPAGEGPGFSGCWGAYPFTRNGLIFASNMDNRLWIFTTSDSLVFPNFTATPRTGIAPLEVQFQDQTFGSPVLWDWSFDDGGSATVQNPSHVFTQGGLYDIGLHVETATGSENLVKDHYITVLGDDTLGVAALTTYPNTAGFWEVECDNAVPITEITLPVTMTNVIDKFFIDSISTVGTRTAYFEQNQLVFDNRFFGQMAVKLRANNGGGAPPLPPGTGPIARVHFRAKINAEPGDTSHLSVGTLGTHSFSAKTITTTFIPAFIPNTLTVLSPCDCSSHGDIAQDDGVLNAVDLTVLINHIFFGLESPPSDAACPHADRGDFNCDGVDNATDLTLLINAIFFGGDGPCDPCACSPYPSSCP